MPRVKRTAEEEEARRDGGEFIESLDRGLRVLQSFGIEHRPMTLSDIAKAANLPRATARRILLTLQKSGFVAGDERLFSLTPRVLALASAYQAPFVSATEWKAYTVPADVESAGIITQVTFMSLFSHPGRSSP
ncbi:MAG: helix-turn-helix domain-containing protein, partial [Pseudomonadota bacterium]